MTREEAKKMLPILVAFAEGKVIECRTKPSLIEGTDVPNDWTEMKEIEFWRNTEYRIKPEQKFRPFKNAEECWAEMQKHQPFGWIKGKGDEHHSLITSIIADDGISGFVLDEIMEHYTFADGTPFGIKE
ncbi:hypothetical protein [Segatella copri]|uniref:hypothetical protein n=1 Tax=Segatella copri TaxID=165179 RepID=UPI001291DB53|nr:hypothetical protein [Segatella copri]MQM90303.1 hypothetical protein [Segatella copri]MQM95777.1 hypothetical protein [Segatella copri]MQN03818.1 hypothetical protein [Segatella copri]MQN16665.1 hypothetical protein [Segatella copri]MQN19182.1 hypothetical protein [Segatella copri]